MSPLSTTHDHGSRTARTACVLSDRWYVIVVVAVVCVIGPLVARDSSGVTASTGTASSGSGLTAPFVKGVDTNLQGWGTSAVPQIAAEMSSLGVNWEREGLNWASAEPRRGIYNWSAFDQVLAAAKANGITILPVVGYAPSWTTPADSADYATFVAAAVARYGPGTSANLPWWELWNEPYTPNAWANQTPNAEAYARDALAAAQAAKGVAPTVKLLVSAEYNDSPQTGGSSPWETTWVDDMFRAAPTLGHWISGVSVHPYGGDPSLARSTSQPWLGSDRGWSPWRIDVIHSQFLAHGVNVPFWVTEAGWSTWDVSPTVQAQYWSTLIMGIAVRSWIRALFPYELREFTGTPTNDQPGYGLLSFGTWAPRPAFTAAQQGFKKLN